jgi:two-component system chemotaxis response regulator CheY
MANPEPELDRIQQRQRARFVRMGLSSRPMSGGRCMLVSLPLSPKPFESIAGPLSIDRVVFSTVGAHQIKCLRPRPLFGLPLLDIRRCADAASIEATIRQAWRNRTQELRESARTLKKLEVRVAAVEGGSVLAFPLPGETPGTDVRMQRLGEAILPSSGPLHGLPLQNLEERVLEVSGCLDSASHLEWQISGRIAELQQRATTADTRERLGRQVVAKRAPDRVVVGARPAKVLLVGTKLLEDAELRRALKEQGYQTVTARSETEALVRLAAMTPDLVISQYGLGRSDGASLVQATLRVPGIERIPVVLVDDAHHDNRREAARIVGAVGYVISPLQTARFMTRLQRLVEAPGNRRFTRYPQRLATRIDYKQAPFLATQVGRGGLFVTTEEDISPHTMLQCEVRLPEVGHTLRFGGEVLYRTQAQGADAHGLGLRICDISSENEAALIEYLAWLESKR